ncbi:MAG: beta-ketoacyl-[acyl-carrier-protein] synthase family protein [Pseudomonadota bacterium]
MTQRSLRKHDVVITAMGVVSPLGQTVDEFGRRMFAGESSVRSTRGKFCDDEFPVPYAAWVDREAIQPSELNLEASTAPGSWLMCESVTKQAVVDMSPNNTVDAIVFGTADEKSFQTVTDVLESSFGPDYNYAALRSEAPVDVIAQYLELKGLNRVLPEDRICLNSACATGNQAIGIAYQGIQSGRWTRCIVGGVDARCEFSKFLNFYALGAAASADVPPETASRPFSKDRSGLVNGEGAAALVMESREAAELRGAEILALVSGYGCTSDAFRLTHGREDGASAIEAMKRAISNAGLSTSDIDYISAHGTGTELNDRLETMEIKGVFGDYAYQIPVSSLKSQIGHSMIAAGVFDAVASVLMLRNQKVAPTINYGEKDPECDLDYVPNASREASVTHILSNSFGFGGENTCVVFSRADT